MGPQHFDHHHGRHLDVAGARIYVQSLGADDAPALVLLHGGFGHMGDFNGLLSAMSPALAGWRVIGIDSRGHGASTLGEGAWTYQRVQHDAEAVLKALAVPRCTLLGFSDGGIVALRMAAARKLPIDRLVVIGATWHHKNLAASRATLQQVTGDTWRHKFPRTCEDYQRLNPEPDFDRLAKALVAGWLDETRTGHPDERVARIQARALVVRGDDDHLTTLEDAAELRRTLLDGHFLGIPFAGHVAHDDGREIFVAGLRKFLAG